MNYHNITKCDMKNGKGLRTVLWLSGCEHYCKECHNPETWDSKSGIEFDKEAFEELITDLANDYVDGLTLSGGDPLFYKNREEVLSLLKEIKLLFPNKSIWVYTGYVFEDISSLEHLKYIDVLVDGKFVKQLSSPSPEWCGSSNQRIIDVKKTFLNNNNIVNLGN